VKKSLIAGAIACAFQPVFAEELPTFDMGTLVVTATRSPQPTAQALLDVTVITPEELRQAGQSSLPEVLQASGVLEVKSTGGPGQQSSLFIRGSNSTHTLVLVDGIRVDNITSGSTAIEHIPVDQIERIEILRGPASSLYGSDAIGGVVQIFTHSAKQDSFAASAGYGNYGTERASIAYSGGSASTRFQIQGGYQYSDSFSATNPSAGQTFNPDRDPYRNWNVSAKLSHAVDSNAEVGLSALYIDSTAHYDSYASASDDTKLEKIGAYSAYTRSRFNASWLSTLTLARGTDDYRFINTSSPSQTRSTQNQATWQNDLDLSLGQLSLGAEYLGQDLSSTTRYDKTSRTVRSAFALYRGDFGAHGVQASARHDDNSQFGSHNTGSLAYGYRITPAWRATASAGTAFKAPTFQDLYYPGYSNPNLQPEQSRSWDAGLHYGEREHSFNATYFENRISDLIISAAPSYLPYNISNARIRGLELGGATAIGALGLHTSLTLQDPIDSDTHKRLRARAKQFGSLGATWHQGSWQLSSELVASGYRFDSNTESASSRMAGYALINLGANYAIDKQWAINARWNNVFDRHYETAQGYNTPGSNLFVALKYQMR
jgi:vitamin B12 transporter